MGADAPGVSGGNKSASTEPSDLDTYLADLNEQAQNRRRLIIKKMAAAEGVTEDLKRRSQREWVRGMNSIVNRAEESVKHELIYT